jgi:hypothetical protein
MPRGDPGNVDLGPTRRALHRAGLAALPARARLPAGLDLPMLSVADRPLINLTFRRLT